MNDIFLSYASEDRDRARVLAEALGCLGWTVWWDPQIPAGKTFTQVIDEALGHSRSVVVVWSETSVRKNWVLEEAEDGLGRGILIPVLIDSVKPPRGFRRIQAAHLWDWDGDLSNPAFRKLVSDIEQVIGPAPGAPEAGSGEAETAPSGVGLRPTPDEDDSGLPPAKTPSAASRKRAAARGRPWLRPLVLAGVPVVVAVAALILYPQLRRDKGLADSEPDLTESAVVAIHSMPSGASVYHEGTLLGTTPIESCSVASGEASVRLEKEGYLPLDTTLTIGGEVDDPLDFRLVAESPTPSEIYQLSFTSRPSRGTILIDGRRVGRTPLAGFELETGLHQVEIQKTGYESFRGSLDLNAGQTRADLALIAGTGGVTMTGEQSCSLRVTLTALTGELRVTSEPSGAAVLLDGDGIGRTPHSENDLRVGSHDLVLRLAGHDDYRTSVVIEANRTRQVNAVFSSSVGNLRVTVIPHGSIYLDGELKVENASAPFVEELSPGKYMVTAEHPEWGSWGKQVDIAAGSTEELTFDFTPEFEFTIISWPRNAMIYVNGQFTGKHTPSLLRLHPGEKTIDVRKEGFQLKENPLTIVLESDLEDALEFELRPVE